MPKQNSFRWSTLCQITASFALVCFVSAHAQPTALLEACYAVDDKDKRLACLKELSTLKSPTTLDTAAATKRVKNSFAAVTGAASSGISLNSWTVCSFLFEFMPRSDRYHGAGHGGGICS